MEVKVLGSKLVKPAYNGGAAPAPSTEYIPLSIFDKVTFNMQMAIIYAFAAPAPSTAAIENGLATVLAQYRAFAGQLGEAPDGTPSFILNDRGARLVEATVDADLIDMAPAKPTPELLKLHPDLETEHEEAHFSKDFIAGLRAKASEGRGRPFSRFETILAHLWRTMTRARDLSPEETTKIRLSVDGRHRLGQPAEYFGNMVLWAFPRSTVGDLLNRPLKHAAQVIHDEVAKVDGAYFQSFVDFASSGAAEKEGLARSAVCKDAQCPDVEVDSWLTFPFYELDFGTGSPSYFMPAYFPTEGMLFLVPSNFGDGSVDAFVPLFQENLQAFKECCYSME
ncbi:unnamed protein product [Triticum turgidum subsp. durum]|uniref:Uncharacterized protein n=1 Tax=Triticum turgidum subsp. durum TaxID=4567 RepID=A0A9R0XEM4_TRITD|nr:unnamed protein product [Triticum turgidum subsp. durum]